jgi:DNA invertase Pin-like site-specific DNA recombinase
MGTSTVRVVTYVRISKDKLGDAHGVANQQAALDKCADSRGWTIVRRPVRQRLSASNGKHRPDFELAMKYVDAGQCDVVLCWAVDRFVRGSRTWNRSSAGSRPPGASWQRSAATWTCLATRAGLLRGCCP